MFNEWLDLFVVLILDSSFGVAEIQFNFAAGFLPMLLVKYSAMFLHTWEDIVSLVVWNVFRM